jgi:anti-anti-sigma factor
MSPSFEVAGFVVVRTDNQALIHFHDEPQIGGGVSPDTTSAFSRELADGGRLAGCELMVSLRNMPAISSSQLGTLLAIHKANGRSGKLRFCDVSAMVRKLFDTAGMTAFFEY